MDRIVRRKGGGGFGIRGVAAAVLATAAFGPALPAAAGYIVGYTDRKSYKPGDAIFFHVSTDAATYAIEIVRDAWTPQSIDSVAGLPGELRPVAPGGWLGPNWPVSYTWVVPANWVTGSYYVRFVASDGTTAFCSFVIRHPVSGAHSRLAFCMDYNTRCAYNSWGGKSLYVGNPASVRVSFRRPDFHENGLGKGAWVTRLAHSRMEEDGFAVEYLTEWDIEAEPGLLDHYDVIVFCAHLEYNTRAFMDALRAHHARGGHLAFFSANDLWWQIRYEDDGATIVSYKTTAIPNDPMYGVNNSLVTTNWYRPLLNEPSEAIQGVTYDVESFVTLAEDYRVTDADHWIFDGTGIQNGQTFGFLMAWGETDCIGRRSPPVVDIVLAAKRFRPRDSGPQPQHLPASAMAVFFEDSAAYGFPGGNGGMVFASGTQSFCSNMQDGVPDYLLVRQVFRNIIGRMVNSPPPAAATSSGSKPSPNRD